MRRREVLGMAAGLLAATGAWAQDAGLIVQKRTWEGGEYRTRGGGVIGNLRLGYQTAGTLNPAGTNAVLICHFFSGNSHAFGRYAAGGPAGYWDAIVGPGKAIDTDRFFVVSVDCLANVNVPDQNTVTTGPASLNPDTGRPWGMTFPVVSMRDFVETQKRLLDSLGVKRLAMVAGPSNGGLQAMEWAAAYPEFIDRVMPVISAEIDAWMQGWLDVWEAPIRLDPNWREGDYYGAGREPPLRGLAEAWKVVTIQAVDRPFLLKQAGRGGAEGQDPARRIGDRFAVEAWLDQRAQARARTTDANSFLYMVRANQLFMNEYPSFAAGLGRGPARWLVISAPTDRVFLAEGVADAIAALRAAGKQVETAELKGELGHLLGVVAMAQVAERVKTFLER